MQSAEQLRVGEWRVDGPGCRIEQDGASVSLEPKVMDLLLLLASRPGEVLGRDTILAELWPGVIVGEDTLARTVSKLRSALNDDSREPAYIETIPKRGYRLIAPVSSGDSKAGPANRTGPWLAAALVLFAVIAVMVFVTNKDSDNIVSSEADLLAGRADDFYMRFTQADNAAAIELYERVIARDPDYARAYAGLSSALVQRVIRWPAGMEGSVSLSEALERGANETPQARELLARATQLAERAVELAPDDPRTLKALGLALSTSGELDAARQQYERAIALNDDAWESLVNLGELALLDDDLESAAGYFAKAYDVMQRFYDREPQRIGPWHAPLGVTVGETYEAMGDTQEAETWYRRVLRLSPYEPEATAGLARILAASGDLREALSLCRNLVAVGSRHDDCDELLAGSAANP